MDVSSGSPQVADHPALVSEEKRQRAELVIRRRTLERLTPLPMPSLLGASAAALPEEAESAAARGATPRPTRRRRMSVSILASGTLGMALLLLLAPALLMGAGGVYAVVIYGQGLWALTHMVATWRIDNLFMALQSVEHAGRIALICGAFYALLFSGMALLAGFSGSLRRRVFLVFGIPLCALSVVMLVTAMASGYATLSAAAHLPGWGGPIATGYSIVDALALAALLVDMRPKRRRAQRLARRMVRGSASRPILRFGPQDAAPR